MTFDRKWLIIVFIVLIVLFFCLYGISQTVKAVTVSTNDIKERNNENSADNVPTVLDTQETAEASDPAGTSDLLESGVEHEVDSGNTGEDGQGLYMDEEFTDSVLDFMNWAYKADLVQIILFGLLCGAALAVLVMQFYMK